jgi:hypothetical protein
LTIRPGARFGPYEIVSALGAGAMGEVYRARDSRLGRDVAIKVLPPAFSSDPESLRRFEKEARAASALNHPNIVTVYEVGLWDSVPYMALELVEGKSLRGLLASSPLPLRRILDIGGQIAEGLAAAHEKGLVHRDLKPQNLMITREGFVKILDFGLAKRVSPASLEEEEGARTEEPSLTAPGTILGTVGYMSPEQARGEPADFRSDQFALGVVLYEMATGKKAFDRGSAIETLSAILRDEPRPLEEISELPDSFCWIVERCLAKEPAERYASTRDLATDLKSLWARMSRATGSLAAAGAATLLPRTLWRRAVPLLAVLAAFGVGVLAASHWRESPAPPVFSQLTFRRGSVWSARFAPDGKSVIYGAAWEGQPFRLFRKGPQGAGSRRLDFPDADLLAVSRTGQIALALGSRAVPPGGTTIGTLAVAPLEGGAPREIENDVLFADWTPDGKELAIARLAGAKTILEFPAGRKVYETDGLVTFPRVSPKGDLVAFLDHPTRNDDRGAVAVVDREGHKRTITPEWATEQGLAWHPRGNEIWFGAAPGREAHAIYAVTLAGKVRVVARAPGDLTLQDISADGRALVTRENWRVGIMVRWAGEKTERDVSWLDFSLVTGLSRSGDRLLFFQSGQSVGTNYEGYMWRREDSSPMYIGEGFAQALSADGSRVLSVLPGPPPQLFIRPTVAGAGQARRVEPRGLEAVFWSDWFPDGRRIVVAGIEPGRGVRLYACEPESGEARAITPEGILLDNYQGFPVSPDGERVAAVLPDGHLAVFPTEGGDGRPVPDLPAGTVPIAWTQDGRRLFVYRLHELPARVFRVDPATGEAELWKELRVADSAGVHGLPSVRIAEDGSAYAYSYYRALSELYTIDGLR